MPGKPTIPRVCTYCGETFLTFPSRIKQGAAKHCSIACSFKTRRRSAADRFWSHVQKSAGCWLWTGATTRTGYGVAEGANGRQTTAHRVAWELTNGPIPDGYDLCHNCPTGDTKQCVRPDHMFVGTRLDNMLDAAAKGATALGTRNGQAKLDGGQVTEIRHRYAIGDGDQRQLSQEYGVTRSLISMIVTRKIWRHV